MIHRSNIARVTALVALVCMSACAESKPELTTDLNAGLEVAAALESAYAARPDADQKKVADLTILTTSAQAAVASWEATATSSHAAVANAAIAALVAYEAAAQISP